jgi:tetratricopeptide (TPR) repeat protein
MHERGFSFQAMPYLKLSLVLCQKANSSPQPLLSDIHLTLGAVGNETNNGPMCVEHNTILLAMRKGEAEKNGKPDVRLGFAHSQMGIAYMMTRKYALATEYFKQSVAILRSLPGLDVDELGFPMANLGLAFWIQGQLDEAEATFEEALNDREKRFGKLDKVSYK